MTKLLAIPLLLACIWDRDTIDDELRGVPDALTLVTGRWHRHSPAYYDRRIKELPARLAANPADFDAYDDLAVAYERKGDRTFAIEIMARKRDVLSRTPSPEHLYRYHANLGTFLAHSGRYAEGLVEIQKALEINPKAHFGRERFQVDLIRYMMAVKERPELWREHDALSFAGYSYSNRAGYAVVREAHAAESTHEREVEWREAYTAMAGILRYGGVEGPELYRILGDLFVANGDLNLAWWSFQHAIEKKHPAPEVLRNAVAAIEDHWKNADYREIPTLEVYRKVRAEADAWATSFAAVEKETIEANPAEDNLNLRSMLGETDRRSPARTRPPAPVLSAAFPIAMAASIGLVVAGVGSGIWAGRRARRRRLALRRLVRQPQAS